jgi:N utilization substance protein A
MSLDLIRIVDSIHREKNIPKEILYEGIESALATAARKHYPNAMDIAVKIDPDSGRVTTTTDGVEVEPPEFGRIAAQTAKQVIIQKIREAERDTLFDEFVGQAGELVTGTVQRFEGGAVTVNLGKTDALLPRSEQIPGESHQPGERVRAVILEVRKVGQRVKIILSRTHPDFVRRLFELEIPEIADGIIQIRALAREAGYRSKVAVSSLDTKVDAVGACVGVRGTRIKNIVDELGGERIDIVRWNDSLQVLIPNALQPAEIDEVMLCHLLGRGIVLVREDQLSLAIGRRGQNVRLASKLVGWDIEIMTNEELDEVIDKAVQTFEKIEEVDHELAERLVEQGILSFDDLSVMEIDDLVATIEGLDEEKALAITERAERLAEEQADELPRRKSGRGAAAAAHVETPAANTATVDGEGKSASDAPTRGADDAEGGSFVPGEDEEEAVPGSAAASTALSDDEGETETDGDGDGDPDDDGSNDIHDLSLSSELNPHHGREVTMQPDDDDLTETERIVTNAVESGSTQQEIEQHEPDSDDTSGPNGK